MENLGVKESLLRFTQHLGLVTFQKWYILLFGFYGINVAPESIDYKKKL